MPFPEKKDGPIAYEDDPYQYQDMILFVDRISGECGACAATIAHPLPTACPDCHAEFTYAASTMFGGSEEDHRRMVSRNSNLYYIGRMLPRRPR